MAIANAVGDSSLMGRQHGERESKTGAKRRSARKVKKERIHVTLGPGSLELLKDLACRTESTQAGVFRNALRLYAAVIDETESGHEFYVKDQDGNLTAYKIFL